jgi:hypothetical protein
MLATLGLAACGDDDDDPGTTAPEAVETTETTSGEVGEEILIKTHVKIDVPKGELRKGTPTGGGEVLAGSTIGDGRFCSGGTFRDRHGTEDPAEPPYGLVDRTFRCPGGTLRIGFTPGVPQGRKQSGPWKVVSGTGAFDGLQGGGQMGIEYDPKTGSSGDSETFTGTVSR